ncbi:ATP-dependent DNA helicase Rep [hydrothermal vent metagenome]|uniref:DNA 3'-5' helicase n=1 Tax=hydrothermal vent metagenome TaxID=652676 RepID=A0A3B0VQZ2_9ZZZZ
MLNPQQQSAVTYCDGPLLVLAGAGCGKTRVITEKIAYLIGNKQISHHAIFAITFTNKAAKEMAVRANKMISLPEGERLNISTFHALGMRIIREEIQHTPYRFGFSIFDSSEVHGIIKGLLPQGSNREQVNQIQWQISAWKNQGLIPTNLDTQFMLGKEVYTQYQQRLIDFNALDFDDLILQTLHLLETNAEVRNRWQDKMQYVLVDEYQDTNGSQYRLLQQLVNKHKNIICVGDDDQSIYGWRGAQAENLSILQQDFANLKIIKLEQNYRSTQIILSAAYDVIKHNPHEFEKKLWSDLGAGSLIKIRDFNSPEQEALQLSAEIDYQKILMKTRFADYAVLYRSNHQAKLVEQVFRSNNIPYVISGGRSFFDFAEIKDLMAYIRLLCNPRDNSAFLRIVNVPRRGIGSSSLAKLAQSAEANRMSYFKASGNSDIVSTLPTRTAQKLKQFYHSIKKLQHKVLANINADIIVDELVAEIDYIQWITQTSKDKASKFNRTKLIYDFQKWIRAFSQEKDINLIDATAQITLQTNKDDNNTDDAVQMMTIHAAKGLEFANVFLIGVEEGILPHRNSIEEDTIEEERRLMYVGMTRAMHNLSLSYVKKRKSKFYQDDDNQTGPSRFLDELPQKYISGYGTVTKESKEKQTATKKAHLAALRAMLD